MPEEKEEEKIYTVEELFADFTDLAARKNEVTRGIINGGYKMDANLESLIRRMNEDLNYTFNRFLHLPNKEDDSYQFQLNEIAKFLMKMHGFFDGVLVELKAKYVVEEEKEEEPKGLRG